jgi:hypothetical protein
MPGSTVAEDKMRCVAFREKRNYRGRTERAKGSLVSSRDGALAGESEGLVDQVEQQVDIEWFDEVMVYACF